MVSQPAGAAARGRDAGAAAKAALRVNRVEIAVDAEHEGLRLDRVLASEIAGYSRSQIQRLIEDGHVTLARVKSVKANTAVREGDVVTVDLPAPVAATPVAEPIAARRPLPGSRRHRRQQAGGHGRAPRRRT